MLESSRLLVRHPLVMKRLRGEIASTLEGSSMPTKNQLMKMPYLSCVIKESQSGGSRYFYQSFLYE